MNKKAKIMLGLSVAPIVVLSSMLISSCSTEKIDPLAHTYQREYQKEMSLFLDSNKKSIVNVTTNTPNGIGVLRYSYCSFQDLDKTSKTYKGWYLLLHDTSNNNEIFASFCGWNYKYLKNVSSPPILNDDYNIPDNITLPNNYSIDGLLTRTIPVKAIGFSDEMLGFKELSNDYSSDEYFLNNILFFDEQFSVPLNDLSSLSVDTITNIFATKYFDLSNNDIKYIFGNLNTLFNKKQENKVQTTIILPESLIFLGYQAINFSSDYKDVVLDFSKTKLIEIQHLEITNKGKLEIKLPPSCIRISKIVFGWDFREYELSTNLENVLYFGEYAFSYEDLHFVNNTVYLNKDAEFYPTSFSEHTTVLDLDGNPLKPNKESTTIEYN